MYRSLLFAVALLWASAVDRPTHAQHAGGAVTTPHDTSRVLSLEAILEDILANNPSLRALRLGAEALATRPEQASALPDPEVMVGYRPLGLDAAADAVPNLRVQQMVPFPGKRALRGEAAAYEAQSAAAHAEVLAEDLELQAKLAYYHLYHIQRHDRHVQHFQESLRGFEEAAAIRYEVGRGTQQAILKAQLERNTLARERLKLAEMRREALEVLARLTNRPDLIAQAGEVVVAPPDVRVDSLHAADVAVALRAEMAALEADERLAETQVALARKEFMPDFSIEAGFMDMGGMSHLGNRFMIGGGITVPLQQGRREAALQEARLRREQVEAEQEALRIEIRTRANELMNRLREEARALTLYEETLIPQAESTLEATLSAYTTGQVDFIDLLDAERMRFELHIEKERTYLSYLQSTAELERVLGVETLADPRLTASTSTDRSLPNHE